MIQRDVLMNQIEMFGRVLGKIIANFFALKTEGNVNNAIEITNQQLQAKLDLDIGRLIDLPPIELEEYVHSLNLTAEHLDILSNFLFEISLLKKQEGKEESFKYLKSAENLLKLAENKSDTITFERMTLKMKIEDGLESSR